MYVKRIDDVDYFLNLKEVWNDFLLTSGMTSPFLRHEWFASWLKNFFKDGDLHVLFVKENSRIIGLAPLIKKNKTWQFIASHHVSDYCDFVFLQDRKAEFFEELLSYLTAQNPEELRVELINIASNSLTLSFLPEIAKRWQLSCVSRKSDVVPDLMLPESYENYLHSLKRKNRHELRRKIKRLESLPGVVVRILEDKKSIRKGIKDFIRLHRISNSEKEKFWSLKGMAQFFLDIAFSFSDHRGIELCCLFSKDRLLAALLNFITADQVFSYNVAFDRNFARYSPGICLFNETIKDAIARKKKRLDFLRGGEKYKYFFGAKDSKIFTLELNSRV